MSNAIRDFLDEYAGGKTKADSLRARAVAEMLSEYENAYNEIFTNLNKAFASGDFGKVAVQANLLKQIGAIIDTMNGGITTKLTNAIVEISKESAKNAIEHMSLFDKTIADGGFLGKYDEEYVKAQFADSFAHVAAQTDKMHSTAKELIRSEAKKVFQAATVRGVTPYAAAKELYKNVTTIDPGFVFVDKAGRKWNTKKYIEMLTHTALSNASIEAYVDEAVKHGQDLFMISRHNTTCPKCKPWESRVVSNTGITPGYPKLSEAKGSGLFHPRCQHRLLVYHKEIHDFMASPDAKKGLSGEEGKDVVESFKNLAAKNKNDKAAAAAKTAENQYYGVIARKLENKNSNITFDKTYPLDGKGMSLGGVPFNHTGPVDFSKIKDVDGIEPGPPTIPSGKKLSCGVIVIEDDGRIWLCEPKNHFGGYNNTFAKGGKEPGHTRQQTAIKEAYEELGLNVEITGFLGDYEKTTSLTRYFIARRTGGDPTKAHWESEYVKLVTVDEAKKILNTDVDQKILEDFLKKGPAEQAALDAAYKVTKKQGKLIAENGMKWALEFENKIAASLKTGENLIDDEVWAGINKKVEALGVVSNLSKSKKAKAAAQAAHQTLSAIVKITEPYVIGTTSLPQTVEALNRQGLLKRKLDFQAVGVEITPRATTLDVEEQNTKKQKDEAQRAAIKKQLQDDGFQSFLDDLLAMAQDEESLQAEKAAKAAAHKTERDAKSTHVEKQTAKTNPNGPDFSKLEYQPGTQGGSNMGGVYLDGKTKYYGKFYQNPEQGTAEEVANSIYKKFGLGAPETYQGQFMAPTGNIKTGIATKYVDGLSKLDFDDPAFSFEIAKFHVVSTLVNNWDVVGMGYDNLLKTKSDDLFVVDSGGSFWFRAQGGPKAFGKDIDSFKTLMDPSVNHYAARVFKGVHDNYMTRGPVAKSLLKWFRDSLADGGIEALVRESFGDKELPGGTALEVFKHRAQLLESKLAEYANEKTKPTVKQNPVGANTTKFLETKEKTLDKALPQTRPAGVTYRRDSDQIEDQAVRFWREKTEKGKELSVARLKLTSVGDKLFMDKVSEVLREADVIPKKITPTEAAVDKIKSIYLGVHQSLTNDILFQQSGEYSSGALALVENAKAEFDALVKKHKLDDKKQYLFMHINQMLMKSKMSVVENKAFDAELYNEKALKAWAGHDDDKNKVEKSILITGVRNGDLEIKIISTPPKRKVIDEDGFLVESKGGIGLRSDYRRFLIKDKATGVEIEYRPRITEKGDDTVAHSEMKKIGYESGAYASEMEMIVRAKGSLSVKAKNKLLENLSTKWGLNTAKASVHDAELMYLAQGLYINKLDKEPWALEILNSVNTPEEKVRSLKAQIKKNMGITLPDEPSADGKNPHQPGHFYDPFGRSIVESKNQGHNVKARWDVNKERFDEVTKGKTLIHATKADLPELVYHLLNGGGNTTPTAERIIRGIPTTGASPEEDMRTGGASYFFTKIDDKRESSAYRSSAYGANKFFFKRDALLRVDAISYRRDMYGRVTGTTVQDNRVYNFEDFPSRIFEFSGNETILKGGLSIIDEIEFVMCRSESDREQVIKTYKDFGYSTLPDGRNIEDVVKFNDGANYGSWESVLSEKEKE